MKSGILLLFAATCIGCAAIHVLKEQKNFFHESKLPAIRKPLHLATDARFEQQRGIADDTYVAVAGSGIYRLVFESREAEFYYAWDADFFCEDHTSGGLLVSKSDSTVYLWNDMFRDRNEAMKKYADEKYISEFENTSYPYRPFVHPYYLVHYSLISVTEE